MTRDEILEAAAQIISQKGFHAASMQEIADTVNLRKASLYHHISSKQEILVDLLDKALDVLIALLTEIRARPISPPEKLRQAVGAYLHALTATRDLSSVLLFEHRSLTEEFKTRHTPRRDQFEGLWRDLIQEGIEGGFYAPTNPSLAAKTLLGTMNWFITWYNPGGPLTSEEIGEYIAALFLDGLLRRDT